uniref:Uncharacterized protein n=1 Tax=viral metagenome TaxID=1070528 RepID=A0A6C0K4F0_9ZZZZ
MEIERKKKTGHGTRNNKVGKNLSSARVLQLRREAEEKARVLQLRREAEEKAKLLGIKNARTIRSMLRAAVVEAKFQPMGSTRREKKNLPLPPIREDNTMREMPSRAPVRGRASVRGSASVRGRASVTSSTRVSSGKHWTRKGRGHFGPGTSSRELKMAGEFLKKAMAAADNKAAEEKAAEEKAAEEKAAADKKAAEEKAAEEKAAEEKAAAERARPAKHSIGDLTNKMGEMKL